MFFFFKQKTAYEIKECDWSSDVCSSDLFHPSVTGKAEDHTFFGFPKNPPEERAVPGRGAKSH